MNKNFASLTMGLLIGLVTGFLFANSYSRRGGEAGASALAPSASPVQAETGAVLSPEEIKAKLEQAAQNPADVKFQRQLGLALYAYGASKGDAQVIKQSLVPLERVLSKETQDTDALVGAGNAYFDIGYIEKNDDSFVKAREYYLKALAVNSVDAGVLVDVGLTFALLKAPDHRAAIGYYEKALKTDPSHERTLQMMVESQLSLGQKKLAGDYLSKLRTANQKNPMIPDFEQRLTQQP